MARDAKPSLTKKNIRIERPISEPVLGSLQEAILADIRVARNRVNNKGDVNEALAERCGVVPKSIYDWADEGRIFTGRMIEAVIAITGGSNTLAFLIAQSRRSPVAPCSADLMACIAAISRHAAAISEQYAQDISPMDNTPGRLDATERRNLKALAEELIAQATEWIAAIESL